MTADDVYTIAGSATGALGFSGDGGPATSAKLDDPGQVALDGTGGPVDRRHPQQPGPRGPVPPPTTSPPSPATGRPWPASGTSGPAVDGELFRPAGEAEDAQGDIYIADAGNNRIQEIAATDHTQWGITMTAGDVYTVAGSARTAGPAIRATASRSTSRS